MYIFMIKMVDKLITKNKQSLECFSDQQKHIFSSFFDREHTSYFLKLFDKIFTENTKLILCCSWWPDSMFLTYLLLRYRHIVKWLPMSITNILHINHATSPSDDLLEALVVKNFWWLFPFDQIKFPQNTSTETVLRKKRRACYLACLKQYTSLQPVYLCLWHNLDDRIENSFLHFDRGTHTQWIINMQVVQKKYYFQSTHMNTYICFRPLLGFPKEQIKQRCDQLSIPYAEDAHNNDTKQKRIQYRKRIQLLPRAHKNQLYEERKWVYQQLEKNLCKEPELKKIVYPSFRDIQGLYSTQSPNNEQELANLLSMLGIYVNMSSIRLKEMMHWFLKKKWSRYISWWWFLFASWTLYLARQEKKSLFREKTHHETQLIEKENHTYLFCWYERDIQKKEAVWNCLAFPLGGDKKWSIPYMQRAAKQHIPFFRRRSLPIMKKNNTIVAVLPPSLWPWKM